MQNGEKRSLGRKPGRKPENPREKCGEKFCDPLPKTSNFPHFIMIFKLTACVCTFLYILDVFLKYSVYYKEWVEKPKEEDG
jgi:hypothetical protein